MTYKLGLFGKISHFFHFSTYKLVTYLEPNKALIKLEGLDVAILCRKTRAFLLFETDHDFPMRDVGIW